MRNEKITKLKEIKKRRDTSFTNWVGYSSHESCKSATSPPISSQFSVGNLFIYLFIFIKRHLDQVIPRSKGSMICDIQSTETMKHAKKPPHNFTFHQSTIIHSLSLFFGIAWPQ